MLIIRVHEHLYEEEVGDHTHYLTGSDTPPITSEKVSELEPMSLHVMINTSLVI